MTDVSKALEPGGRVVPFLDKIKALRVPIKAVKKRSEARIEREAAVVAARTCSHDVKGSRCRPEAPRARRKPQPGRTPAGRARAGRGPLARLEQPQDCSCQGSPRRGVATPRATFLAASPREGPADRSPDVTHSTKGSTP